MADPTRIMIIEDDTATLEYLMMLLETQGYVVHGALNGADGKTCAMSAPVQVILLDRRLPDIDGLVLCQELRANLGTDIPIIIMTADAEAGLLAASQAAGASRLLRKPFMPQTLLDVITTELMP